MPLSHIECLGLIPESTFLMMQILGRNLFWLKWLGPCNPCGRPWLSSELQTFGSETRDGNCLSLSQNDLNLKNNLLPETLVPSSLFSLNQYSINCVNILLGHQAYCINNAFCYINICFHDSTKLLSLVKLLTVLFFEAFSKYYVII